MLKVRDGRLEWTQVMRSNDIFRGIPYDFIQFTFMQEIMAGWLGIRAGAYCHVSDSLHAYVKDLPNITAAFPVTPERDNSDLSLPFVESENTFRLLSASVDHIIDSSTGPKELIAQLSTASLATSYRDMLAVLTAEGLRLRGDILAAHDALVHCTNPLYRQLWLRWLARYPAGRKSIA